MKKTIPFLFVLTLLSFSPSANAFRYVVYGDSRSSTINPPFNTDVLTYINSQVTSLDPAPDFVFFLGDSVRRAQSGGHSYLGDWHTFMTNTLNGIPLYMVCGNSDIYGDTGWTEFSAQQAYQSEFTMMPSNGPSPLYQYLTYSFEFGEGDERSLFTVLDAFLVSAAGPTATHNDNNIDDTQISWFKQQLAASSAPHKFVLSHGPAFSPEGWPVGNGVRQVWDNATDCEVFFCSHEHLYSRWAPYPFTVSKCLQILTGTNGAPIDSSSANWSHVDAQAHPFYGYNFVVVDVEKNNVVVRTYGVTANGNSYTTQQIDAVRISK